MIDYALVIEGYKSKICEKCLNGKLDIDKALLLSNKLDTWSEQPLPQKLEGKLSMAGYNNDVESMVKELIEEITFTENVKMGSLLKGKTLMMEDDDIDDLAEEIMNEFDIDVIDSDTEKWLRVSDVVSFVKGQVE